MALSEKRNRSSWENVGISFRIQSKMHGNDTKNSKLTCVQFVFWTKLYHLERIDGATPISLGLSWPFGSCAIFFRYGVISHHVFLIAMIWGFPPKSSILIGIFHYKPSILGVPLFLETPIFSPFFRGFPAICSQRSQIATLQVNHVGDLIMAEDGTEVALKDQQRWSGHVSQWKKGH